MKNIVVSEEKKEQVMSKNVKSIAQNVMRIEGVALLIALLIMGLFFTILSPHFLNFRNILNIGRSGAVMGISATGVTIGLIGGAFDLSIASVADLSAVIASLAYLNLGFSAGLSILTGLLTGVVCGIINGTIVAKFRINPIIATLATAGIFRGIAFLLTRGMSHAVSGDGFKWMGRSEFFGIPSAIIVLLVVMGIGFVVLSYTKFGRNTYSVGGNPVACRLVGINIDKHRIILFVIISVYASMSGIVLLSKLGTLIPNASAGTELLIIASAILGGTALAGGGGTIQGTLIGVLIFSTLRNGLIINNVNAYWQQIASGVALVIAVAFDQLRTGGYK